MLVEKPVVDFGISCAGSKLNQEFEAEEAGD